MTGPRPHAVLDGADGDVFGSLRKQATSRQERFAIGEALRREVPRRAMGRWEVPADRRDVVDLVRESHEGRLDELVPIRVARMMSSPYGFLRGAAVVMAEDCARLPATGINPVICGDAHLGNFGFYASPEGQLVIDLNDFDEAHPGGWEWDLRRLVASIWVAGRENSCGEEQCASAVGSCVSAHRAELAHPSEQPLLQRSYNRLDVDRLHDTVRERSLREEISRSARRARNRTSDRASWSISRRYRPSATRCSAGPSVRGLQFYVRQFRNMKGTIALDATNAAARADYAGVVGLLLAKGHARTSGASMIAGYVRRSDSLDRALARFGRAYADQTEADHAALVRAVRRGTVPVTEGAARAAPAPHSDRARAAAPTSRWGAQRSMALLTASRTTPILVHNRA